MDDCADGVSFESQVIYWVNVSEWVKLAASLEVGV